MRVLVTAVTKTGAIHEIAEVVAEELLKRGLDVSLMQPSEVRNLEGYDAMIIGSAVHAGRWAESVKYFAHWFADVLVTRPVWLFSSESVGDDSSNLFTKAEHGVIESGDAVQLVEETRAIEHRVFTGKLVVDGSDLCHRVAMKALAGPEQDFLDPAQIEAWASGIADALLAPSTSAGP
jgi:menaquinone-dependent protoporphyrinogen oxidase